MGSQDVCIEAIEAMTHVVDQVRDDQWDMEMPSDFPMADTNVKKTLREVINGFAYDIAWIPDMIAGKTMDEAGRNKFEGDLLGDDPKANFVTIAGTSIAAIRDLSDLDRTVHCSYADYPAHNYFVDISGYYGMSAYDIAKAIGVDPTLPPSLVEGLWEQLEPVAEEWRAMGLFGPKVNVPEDADLHARLLGLTGRQP